MSNSLHNKGQEDASEGKCERPHGAMDSFLAGLADVVTLGAFGSMSKVIDDENDSYDAGQKNTNDQKKK